MAFVAARGWLPWMASPIPTPSFHVVRLAVLVCCPISPPHTHTHTHFVTFLSTCSVIFTLPHCVSVYSIALISPLLSPFPIGTRYHSRGVDAAGHCANYIETEQILTAGGLSVTYTQIRGSIPIFWGQQPDLRYGLRMALEYASHDGADAMQIQASVPLADEP
jgi:hypothetical protein